jgi:hypothetical protein
MPRAGPPAWAVTGIGRPDNGVTGRALAPEEQVTVVQFTRFRPAGAARRSSRPPI